MLAGCGSEQQVTQQIEHEAVECPMATDNVAKLKKRIKRLRKARNRLKRVNKSLRRKLRNGG